MTLRARLVRLEAGRAEELIEAPLDPEVKLFALEHHLLLAGEAGALAYALKLQLQREHRPRIWPPTPPEVEERFEQFRRAHAAELAVMDPAERAALDRADAGRTARARQILEQAEGAGLP